jgi:predicted Co/Zn/Cd cation transporter (cation efflux family)
MNVLGEQGFLRISVAATVGVAGAGIVCGLLSGSYSIAFDGAYSLIDAGMTLLAVWVSGLIVKSGDGGSALLRERFTMGLWHLEPIVLALNGALLVAVATYALINAVITALHGGNELRFGIAIVYAVVTAAVCAIMAAAGARVNRRLKSDFVALDVKAWVMSGGIALALLIAFLIGHAVADTPLAWLSHYVDPVVLGCVCLVIIPIPVMTVLRALSQILLMSPADLKRRVGAIAEETVRRQGFLSYRLYVAKVGRATQAEIHFIVPKSLPARTVEQWDRIRDEVGRDIGGEGPDRWLTIVFTADARWAE